MPDPIHLMPGQRLKFPEADAAALGTELAMLIDDLEREQGPYIRNIRVWWDLYEAKPISEKKFAPFEGASNLIVPLIRWQADAVISRFINTLFAASKFWTTRTQVDEFARQRQHVEDFLNWGADGNEYDLFMPSYDGVAEAVPIGSGVLALNWVTRREQMFIPGEGGKPKPQDVTMGRGPVLEHVPREHILWESDSPIQDSEIVVRQSLLTRSQYARMAQRADWDKDVVADTLGRTTESDSVGAQVRQHKRKVLGLGRAPSAFDLHDVRECWVRWPLLPRLGVQRLGEHDADTPLLPIVVTIHKQSRRVLRAIALPYLTRGWPFYELPFRRISGRTISGGITKMLDHLQRGATTLLNQAVDTITIANSINYITNDPSLLGQDWAPNRPLLTEDQRPLNDIIKEISASKLVAPDLSLLTGMFGMSERVIGINDPNLGRETRLGGHPSPATSTLTLLAESKEMLRASLKMIRHQYTRIGEDIAVLYQQFESDAGKIVRALGRDDAQSVTEWLFPAPGSPIPGNLQFDVRALSETLNPDQERQKALLVSQVTANYFSRVLQALQVRQQAAQQGARDMVGVIDDAVRAFTEGHRRFLETSDIDDTEVYLAKLQESNTANEQLFGEIERALQGRLAGVAQDTGVSRLPAVPTGADELPLGVGGTAVAGAR